MSADLVVLQSTQIRKDAKMKKNLKENWFVSPSGYISVFILCSFRKNPLLPHRRSSEVPSGMGVFKAKIKKQSMK